MRSLRVSGLIACCIALATASSASQLVPKDLGNLARDSQIILVGRVLGVEHLSTTKEHGETTKATIRVVSILKGQVEEGSFTLLLHVGGLKGFDLRLRPEDKAVFFLGAVESGEGRLISPGSVGIFDTSRFR